MNNIFFRINSESDNRMVAMTIGFVERVMYLRGMRALNLFFFWENLEIISYKIFPKKGINICNLSFVDTGVLLHPCLYFIGIKSLLGKLSESI